MLPFLKNKKEASIAIDSDSIKREPDDGLPEFSTLDAVCEDLMDAIHSKDKGLLKSALEALCEHMQDMDIEQDKHLMDKE